MKSDAEKRAQAKYDKEHKELLSLLYRFLIHTI